MDNIQANIVVAVESSNAEKQIGRVRDRLSEVTDQRIKDLKIAESKARLEVAEYKSMEAAQVAYNAKLKEEEKIKQIINAKKKGYFVDEIKQLTRERMSLHAEYLKASENEASANYNALKAKIAYDNLSSTFNKTGKNIAFASKNMKDFTYQTAAARTASRLLGFDLGGGSNLQILKGSIIAAGAFSFLKIAKFSVDEYIQKFKDMADYAKMNSEEIKLFSSRINDQIEKQKEAIDSISKLQEKEELSNVEKLEMIKLIESLGNKYKYLTSEIDKTTGKLKNFDNINSQIRKDLIENEKLNLQRQSNAIKEQIMANNQIANEENSTLWGRIKGLGLQIITGGKITENIQNASKENISLVNKRLELEKKIDELDKVNLEKNTFEEKKAKTEDRIESFKEEVKQLDNRLKIQNLINNGLDREAKLLEIRNSLSKRYDLTQEQKNEIERIMSNKKKTPDLDSNKSFKTIRGLGLLRTTAENVVGANTLEGIRLQSRILNKGSEEVDKRILGNAQKQTVILEKIQKNTEGVKIAPQKENFTPFYLLSKEYQKKKIKEANMNINKFINPLSGGPVEKFLPKPEEFNGWQKILDLMNPNPKGEKIIWKFDENGNLIKGKGGKALDFSKIPDQKLMDIFYKNFINGDLYKKIPTKENLEKIFDSGPLWEKFLNEGPKGEKQVLRLGEDGIVAGIKTNKISDIPKDLKNMVAFLKEMRDDIHNIRRNGNTMNIRAV